jgi:hypothetical protein
MKADNSKVRIQGLAIEIFILALYALSFDIDLRHHGHVVLWPFHVLMAWAHI